MANKVIWEVLVVQIMSIAFLFFIIIYLLRTSKAIQREKRISKFALRSIKYDELAFFEKINQLIWKIIRGFSKLLKKSVFISRYGTKYDKHVLYEDRDFKEGLDYVSMKIIIGLSLVLFNILTIMFQYVNISGMGLFMTFLIGFFLPDIFLRIEFNRKRQKIADDLLKAIIIMNNAFKSGRNIMQAIEIVKNELDGAISDEFSKIYMDINYGLSLEVVFGRFYDRIQLDDAKYITSSLTLLNKTGGNIVKVFSSIEKSFFNKRKLRNELKAMTASSVFVFRLLIAMPFLFSVVIFILNPSYFAPLFKTALGLLIIGLLVIIFASYIFIIKKILRVDL